MPNSISKTLTVDMNKSVGVTDLVHATTFSSRRGRRNSETTSVSRRYIRLEFDIPELDFDPLEILSAARNSEQMILEAWCFGLLELAQPLVVRGIDDNDRRLAVFGHGLWRALRGFEHGA